ncbi:hypothetical protein [Rubritalea tangerina]
MKSLLPSIAVSERSRKFRGVSCWFVFSAFALGASSVFGQAEEPGFDQVPDLDTVLEQRKVDIKRHLPTNKKGVEASVKTGQRAVAPQLDPDLARKFEKVRALHASKLAYLEAAKKGEVQSFPDVIEKWPTYQQQVQEASELHSAYLKQSDAYSKMQLHDQLMRVLQPVGFILRSGSYQEGYKNILSKEQVEELERLSGRFNAAADSASREHGELELVSPSHVYTLTHVPVELAVRATPGTEVLFQAEAGGLFPNKLSLIAVTADESGVARTTWVTEGDAINTCPVSFQSPSAWGRGSIEIEVVSLVLIDPQSLVFAAQHAEGEAERLRHIERVRHPLSQ